ncbi:MAG: hypothetical protein HRU38_16260 [Saccharospirillaceae bacterium]|nr:hypothetical protein [Pseudomonadales bacterium]NRB80196.1 hypothetical protein [Saccharospirillaceae bacterium]
MITVLLLGGLIGPLAAQPTPKIVSVFPSSNTLPSNTLRFYIHFSEPMQQKVSASYIRLENSKGVVDTQAFMNFSTELWSPDAKRLTLLLDPGRIKRGVNSNEALGPALVLGKNYNLVIDGAWPTYEGKFLQGEFVKAIFVEDPYRTIPSLENWSVTELSGSELKVNLDRIFDSALLKRLVLITDEQDLPVMGEFVLGAKQRSFTFIPNQSFKGKFINIIIDPRLEDIAGNNFRALLDSAKGFKKIDPILTKQVALVP